MTELKETLIELDKYVTKTFYSINGLTNKHDRLFDNSACCCFILQIVEYVVCGYF